MAPAGYRIGFWGEVTSTLDWCEANYEISYYFAEFWNTLSNLVMIVPPLLGFLRCGPTPKHLYVKTCYLLLTTVGIGSWLFHMTLKYQMQLFDELPMLWGSLFLVFLLTPVVYPSTEDSFWFKTTLICYGIISTTIYLAFVYPILFQVCYGMLVAFVLYLNICIVRSKPCAAKFVYYSTALYYIGFFIWNLDNIYCDYLGRLRENTPACLKPLTQGHAIWHCFAGYGSYMQIYFVVHARAAQRNIRVSIVPDWFGYRLVFPGFTKQNKI